MTLENLPSDKKFGLFFAAIFFVGFGYSFYRNFQLLAVFSGLASVGFFGLATCLPHTLRPLNLLWYRLGNLLGLIVSPLVLGIIFFVLLTPLAVLLRLAGRDALALKKFDRNSYWVNRDPVGPDPESFKDQF